MDRKKALAESISKETNLDPEQVLSLIERPKSLSLGDYAFPCFLLAKELKKAPPAIASELAESITLPEGFSGVTATGPYLNFALDRALLADSVISEILEGNGVENKSEKSETIVIEYSSPNIAKNFHMGNLRTTLIGHSLDQILRAQGHNVISVNHLGDWGTQFGFVYAGCELWGKPEDPTVDQLVELYVKANTLRKAQDAGEVPSEDQDKPDVNAMAQEYFRKLEAGDEDATQFWNWCVEISNLYLDKLYGRLGIQFDFTLGESFYRDQLEGIEQYLRDSGKLEESRGDLGMDLGKELGFVRIFTKDGRSLYITRDIAAAIYRNDTYAPDKILYVVGNQQALHFKQLIEVLKRLEHPVAEKIIHVPYGWVQGQRTRGGSAINLSTFLTEAHSKALNAYQNEVTVKPEGVDENLVAEAVAIGAMYYYYFSQSNPKDMTFTWEKALTFQGDTGPYLQYALARLNSIERKAEDEEINADPACNRELIADDASYEIVSQLAQFQDALDYAEKDYDPHHVATYLLSLAKTVSKSYKALRVIGEESELATARLTLFAAAKQRLKYGLGLIGVPPVERM